MIETSQKRFADLVRARTVIHPEYHARESELMMLKWFDYRFMSPLEATLHFHKVYRAGQARYLRRYVDVETAAKVANVVPRLAAERTALFTQLWDARQRADRLFVPYEILVDFGFEFASRRTRRMTPLPVQLHASARTHDAWWPLFMEYVEEHLPIAMRRMGDMPQYRVENDMDLPAQIHFRQTVAENLAFTPRVWSDKIADVIEKRHLRLEDGLSAAPAHMREELMLASQSLTQEGPPVVNASADDMLLSCFGVSESIDMGLGPCLACPLHANCVAFAGAVEAQTKLRTGYSSPVYEADKARNRKNTANSRRNHENRAPASLAGGA